MCCRRVQTYDHGCMAGWQGVRTEREVHVLQQGGPVFRVLLARQ